MEKWEMTARDFINSCHFKNDIESVFLVGSHASGNADEFSDIDLYIILSDEVKWRKRGNKRVGGFLIEYFANPMRQIKKYIDSSYPNVELHEVTMILGGIVIFDKNATANELIDYCRQKITSEFPKMNEFNVKTGLYHLWNNYDELNRAYSIEAPDFKMQFYRFIQSAFDLYSRYICSPVPSYHNLYKWLTNSEYFKKYGLPIYNDQKFLEMIKLSLECKNADIMFDIAKVVYAYVANNMGGFDIDNFALHSQCD